MLKKIKETIAWAITQDGFLKIYLMVVGIFLLGVFLGILMFNDLNCDCKRTEKGEIKWQENIIVVGMRGK